MLLSDFSINATGHIEIDSLKRTAVFKLMQFTGLLDKNGKEVFEGDILSHDDTNGRYEDESMLGKRRIVKWNEKNGGFNLHPKHWEVIGNIYENPELLP